MGQRRRLAQTAADRGAQIRDHPREPLAALGRAGRAWCARHPVHAGAVDRMGEHVAACAVGIVRVGQRRRVHETRRNREQQRRFGVVGVPICGIGAMKFPHPRADRRGIDQGDHQVVVFGAKHFQCAAQCRGVRHVRVDDEQAAHAAVIRPRADLLHEFDHRHGLHRDGARPAPTVAAGHAVGQSGQHRHPRPFRHRAAQFIGEHRVHAAAQVRAVLFGGAHRQQRRSVHLRKACGQFGPRGL